MDKNKEGAVAYITSNSFLGNPTFRGMRYSLLQSFDKICILNLHGNSRKKETAPDGGKDENVFNIMTGVSINLFIKTGNKKKNDLADVFYADLYGSRTDKFAYLQKETLDKTRFTKLTLREPYYFFVPKDFSLKKKYENGFSITDLMPVNSTGIVSMGDSFIISDSKIQIQKNIQDFLEHPYQEHGLKEKYSLGKNYAKWILQNKPKITFDTQKIIQIDYRPFDKKYTYYDPALIWRLRANIMQHFLNKENWGLHIPRQCKKTWKHIFISNTITEYGLTAIGVSFGAGNVFPLYLYNDTQNEYFPTREPNLDRDIIHKLETATGLTFVPEEDGQADHFAPIDVLDYIYGVLHSNKYRTKYQEFLKIDFPRVPYPASADYFRQVAALGREIRQVHLLEHPCTHLPSVTYPINGLNVVEKITYENGKVFINSTQYFDNVPQTAWEFFIGGHQPAQKWLKDRKGKALTYEDLQHYPRIIAALQKTYELMQQVDKVVKI